MHVNDECRWHAFCHFIEDLNIRSNVRLLNNVSASLDEGGKYEIQKDNDNRTCGIHACRLRSKTTKESDKIKDRSYNIPTI